jgi:aspartate-semialdehyde dehydrogenase
MGISDLAVSATCVRVPVFRAHSAVVTCEFERPLSPDEARAALRMAPGVEVLDDPKDKLYPTPARASGRDEVLVGRVRRDSSAPSPERSLVLFCAGDQLRKGAALNAVQIAERLPRSR